MKTREQIIEDYFRARGAIKDGDYWYFQGWEFAEFPEIDKHFNLFREHVIEVMQAKGWYLTMATYSNGAWWWKTEGITEGTDIHHGETVLLAAIEAATLVLEGEKG